MASPILTLLLDKTYWTARSVISLTLMSVLCNLAGWVWVVFVIQPTSERTLLHYTVQGGVDVIGPGTQAYFVPVIALALLIVNTLLGSLLFKREKFLAHFLLGMALFLQALFFVGAVTISLAAS